MKASQIIEALGTKATAAATGAVSNAKYFMAYIKQVVTLAIAIKERTDLIPDDPADQSEIVAEIDANEAKIDDLDSDLVSHESSQSTHRTALGTHDTDIKALLTTIEAYIDTEVAAIITDLASAVPEPPTAKSLQDILHKDTNYGFTKSTDALQAISDDIDQQP